MQQERTSETRAALRRRVSRELVDARRVLREIPEQTLEKVVALYVEASDLGDRALMTRSLAIQGQIAGHFGDLHGAAELSVQAQKLVEKVDDPVALGESCALGALVSYYTGSFAEAFEQVHAAVRHADASDDPHLKLFARRTASFVLGTSGLDEADALVEEMVAMAVAIGDKWEEANARNDRALTFSERDRDEDALREIARALTVAEQVSPNTLLRSMIVGSQAEIELKAGMPELAAQHADEARALLEQCGKMSPYLLSATIGIQLQVRTALGELELAQQVAEEGLGQMVGPATRINGIHFAALAEALKDAGRWEDAYEALSRAAELDRAAFRALEDVRLDLERAKLEATFLRDQLERDWLTGLYSRRFIANELDRSHNPRFAGPVAVAAVDIDHFKVINDSYGHAIGDEVLIRFAELLRDAVRALDMVVRSGGEEFLLVMPTTNLAAATVVGERIRGAVEARAWDDIAAGLKVTVSIGVAAVDELSDFDELVNEADANLYEAKRSGRNRVVSA